MKPSDVHREKRTRPEYQRESWEDHAHNCLVAFEQIKSTELQSLRLLDRLIGKHDPIKIEGLVALSIGVHDLGKLNKDWQENIGVETGEPPLAHIPEGMKIKIPHAPVSAYAISSVLECLLEKHFYELAFELAIGHHHHTRAEAVPRYSLGWREIYERLIREVDERYCLNITENIKEKIETPTKLDTPFLDIEKIKCYTVYCIVARFIRLSDQESFNVNKASAKIY